VTTKALISAIAVAGLLVSPTLGRHAPYQPPAASGAIVSRIKFTEATPLDQSYKAEFDRCDRSDMFEGEEMPGMRRCSDDPNRVAALLRFPNGTIFFESKLALDIDGSRKACRDPGRADQCGTWFKWKDRRGLAVNVDADKYPFVVIPIAGLNDSDDHEFRRKTGIRKGDLGVVIYRDRLVPVFVADGGPHNKLGEGSAALLKALGADRCRRWDGDHCQSYRDYSIPGKVLYFLFPNSRLANLTPDNALERIHDEALKRFRSMTLDAKTPGVRR